MSRLLVPAYFHPALRPQDWDLVASAGQQIRMVVLNLASGPGIGPDSAFLPVLDRVRRAGIPVAGYVDTAYGRRTGADALLDLVRYRDWYPVDGVFFDRASTAVGHVGDYAALSAASRKMGARVVAFHHGAHPVEDYAEHADVLGTFEGQWAAYRDLVMPSWVYSYPAERFAHLVYDVPEPFAVQGFRLACQRNAGLVQITDAAGMNPWGRLPSWFARHTACRVNSVGATR